MEPATIFILQFVMSTFVIAFITMWYAVPWLAKMPTTGALSVLIAPHAFRHIGLAFLVPSLNAPTMPYIFSGPASYGDLAAAVLAVVSLTALRGHSRLAPALIWIFNVIGTLDLINALRQVEAIDHFGATWFIPTFFVPLLLVSHAMIFVYLLKRHPIISA